jgi:hypothetical protein
MQAISTPTTGTTEGVVVRSAVKAGRIIGNHAEGVVDPKPALGTTESAELDGVMW